MLVQLLEKRKYGNINTTTITNMFFIYIIKIVIMKKKKISARMHMLIRNFVISPTSQMLVYFLANPIYCSKQQRSISECANVHADPSLL